MTESTNGQAAEISRLFDTASYPADLNRRPDETQVGDNGSEPTRVITVRLPRSLHLALKDEAQARGTSMNQLCIVKLVQALDEMNSVANTNDMTGK